MVQPTARRQTTSPLMNLAQQAGSLRVIVVAQKVDGFDAQWLQNAVLEPLDEADIDVN